MATDIEGSGRIFGPAVRKTNSRTGLFALDNDRFNQHHRCDSNIGSMYGTSRTFGLGLKSSVFGSRRQNDGGMIQESDNSYNYNQANISSLSRPFESRLRHEKFKLGYCLENNDRLNDNFRSRFDQSVFMAPRLFGSHSALDVGSNMEGNVKLNQQLYVTNYKSNDQINMPSMCRPLGPLSKNTSWSTGTRVQESLGLADEGSSNGGFRRPIASKVIKGRNSTMSSRLFSYQNIERNTKNLSNINGFNVSHISRRGVDTLSEIRLPLDGRYNWIDNPSVSGSVLSVTSAKAQFMNLLENLHHSILKIVPNLPDSVKVEFDKVKEGLENINEMSSAPVKEADGTSVISHSSRFICSQIPDHTSAKILDVSSIPLKTGQHILKTRRMNTTNETNLLPEDEEGNEKGMNPSIAAASKHLSMTLEEDSALLFKKPKPKPYSKRKRNSHFLKIKTPQVTKHLTSETKNTVMSLKQWYPIAVGRNLEFCGINEDGAILRTKAMKKRVNNRRIELSNGIVCNLVGSPDTLVSAFPKKVISLLKNGLTDRWRVLQKELLNCRANKNESEIKESENSKVKCNKKSSPLKKVKNTASPPKDEKKLKLRGKKLSPGGKNGTVISPSINKTVRTVQTRSGRTVKRPVLFPIDFGCNKMSSELMLQSSKEDSSVVETLGKKSKNTDHEISNIRKKSPGKNIKKRVIVSPMKKSKACSKLSPGKKSKKIVSPKASRIASPKKGVKNGGKKTMGDATTVHSSTELSKREVGSQESRTKRKRKIVGDADFIETKRSKPENKMEAEVESIIDDGELPTKSLKKNKRSTDSGKRSSGTTDKKATRSKMKKASNKKNIINEKSEVIKEKQNRSDWEGEFELLLDDIKIPEIGNISSKPQLSRSQLKIVGMETPPLKYFNNNLKILRSATPVQSPEWSISQRTESEVKQFQKRRAEAHKKKITVEVRRSVVKEKGKTDVQSRDLKNVLDWVAEKNMRSPQWNSRVLQYVIPSRKQIEQEDEYEEDDNIETKFFPH